MAEPLLVLVTGPPASGKTVLAEELGRRLHLPVLAKDAVKEPLLDALGAATVAESRRVGAASFGVLFRLAEDQLRLGVSLILEANLSAEVVTSVQSLVALAPRAVQIHCDAPEDVLMERYKIRRRHPGHFDAARVDDLRRALASGRHDPLPVADAKTIRIDTSEPVDLGRLTRGIDSLRVGRGAAAAILDDDGRILLIKENYDRRRYGFPGGALEPGEAPTDTVIRETREEAGVGVRIEHLVGIYGLDSGFVAELFRCSMVDGVPSAPDSGEIAEVGWFPPDALPAPVTNLLHHALPDVIAGRRGVVRDRLARIN